jgi:UDP-N-acetylglucosamine/UDP-N-acetylgalactosamine diphosphorylase
MQNKHARFEKVFSSAKSVGQENIFRFWDSLNDIQKETLLSQAEAIDFENIQKLIKKNVLSETPFRLPEKIEPAEFFPADPRDEKERKDYENAWKLGEEAIRNGKVAAFTVAGGSGTRLGFEGPKGTFAISPIQNKTLFQLFSEYIQHCRKRYCLGLRWYIMTSDTNHDATVSYFRQNNYFDLPENQIRFFQQGMMPAFSRDGKILLDQPLSLSLSPDGHGGSLRALRKSGALEEMKNLGIDYISYFQVDNPLVRCIDPHFIGLHILRDSEMSSKAIPKAHDLEKVGNFAMGDGKLMVIEYSDLPDALAVKKNANGERLFDAGSIAIHVLSRDFVERITVGDLKLPYHRAIKKVPFIDEKGNTVKPSEPNAIKLEQFVFDAIPLAKNSIVVQTKRAEEFSPVKNADGADSPAACRRDLIARAVRWLESAGIFVENNQTGQPASAIEISPLRAIFAHDLTVGS